MHQNAAGHALLSERRSRRPVPGCSRRRRCCPSSPRSRACRRPGRGLRAGAPRAMCSARAWMVDGDPEWAPVLPVEQDAQVVVLGLQPVQGDQLGWPSAPLVTVIRLTSCSSATSSSGSGTPSPPAATAPSASRSHPPDGDPTAPVRIGHRGGSAARSNLRCH